MAALPKFPFNKLPPKLQGIIVKTLDVPEMFFLSQCSTKCFDIVRIANSRPGNHPFLELELLSGDPLKIDLQPGCPSLEPLFWEFYYRRAVAGVDWQNSRAYKVHGMTRTISLCPLVPNECIFFGCNTGLSSSEIFLFIAQIIRLFNASVQRLMIDPQQMDCLRELIASRALTRCQYFSIEHGRVTHEEMDMILEGVQSEQLSIGSITDRGFSSNKKICCSVLNVDQGSWINLLNLDCKKACLRDCKLTNQDFNAFIRQWLDGTDTKLEYLDSANLDIEELDQLNLTEIVKGLPTHPGTRKRQDATSYEGHMIAYENGFDFKRDSDGILATVMLFPTWDEYQQNSFLFVVWLDPNPYLP